MTDKHVLFYSSLCSQSRVVQDVIMRRNMRQAFVYVDIQAHQGRLPAYVTYVPMIKFAHLPKPLIERDLMAQLDAMSLPDGSRSMPAGRSSVPQGPGFAVAMRQQTAAPPPPPPPTQSSPADGLWQKSHDDGDGLDGIDTSNTFNFAPPVDGNLTAFSNDQLMVGDTRFSTCHITDAAFDAAEHHQMVSGNGTNPSQGGGYGGGGRGGGGGGSASSASSGNMVDAVFAESQKRRAKDDEDARKAQYSPYASRPAQR